MNYNMSERRTAQRILFLSLALAYSLQREAAAYNTTCSLPQPVAGAPMRPVVSNQFTVHVEATFVDKNSTIEFVEYFDYDNNRGKLRQTKHGFVTEYYYDYNTNELLVVSPDTYTCQVQKLSTAGYTFVLGDSNGHVYSPAAALRFGSQTGPPEVYVGKATVRGINVNQWTSCQDWPQSNTTMQITWSFIDNSAWVASASALGVPVLCHVTGRVYSDDQSYRSFEHFYEFVHFIDNIPRASQHVFETPSGVVCPGRKNTKPLPVLPPAMTYTGETINEQRKAITYTEEKYDTAGRIVVYHFRGYTSFSQRFGTNPIAVVNDFNTGTEYVVDEYRGNCTMSPLSSTPDVTHTTDLVTLRMRSAFDVLNLNGNYTYQGKRTIRGMPCDVWITKKQQTDLLGVPINATFEWAFSTSDWTYQNEPSGVTAVPVQAIYTLDDFGSRQQAVTNVYDYVASVPDVFEGVNLDSCFIGRPRNLVTFSISRVFKTLLQYFQSQFKYAVRHSISQSINVSPLRVANIQYTVQQFSLDVRLHLLSVPDVHSRVVDPATELPLEQATEALIDAVQGNRLVIQLQLESGEPAFIVADPRSVRVSKLNQLEVVTGSGTPPAPRPTPTPFPTPTPLPYLHLHSG